MKGLGLGTASLACPGLFRLAWAQGGPSGLSARDMDRVLSRALARGGHYADLFLETRARTHIIITSSDNTPALEAAILRKKPFYYHVKTFGTDELLLAVQNAVERSRAKP